MLLRDGPASTHLTITLRNVLLGHTALTRIALLVSGMQGGGPDASGEAAGAEILRSTSWVDLARAGDAGEGGAGGDADGSAAAEPRA